MKKKILLVVLAMLLALSCLFMASCSCEGPDNPESSSSEGGEESSGGGDKPGSLPSASSTAIDNIYYLRISEIGDDSVTVKFNVYVGGLSYDIRYSEDPITEENFEQATKATDVKITGTREVTAEIKDITASLDKAYYIAARSTKGTLKGLVHTVRAGGDLPIQIDYTGSIFNVYHGESLRDFSKLFDEQADLDNPFYFPETNIGVLYNPETNNDGSLNPDGENNKNGKVGMLLYPIVDLEYMHQITNVKIHYKDIPDEYTVTIRWAKDEVNFNAENSEWDGFFEYSSSGTNRLNKNWNTVEVDAEARYVQVVFNDGKAPNEIGIFGYQSGEGDPIATERRELPTVGDMMGMCGFVAIGGGNTPTKSILCTTVMREYHNFGWSYNDRSYPGKSNIFNGTMGNFDAKYKEYSEAGILVVPCFQWPNYEVARQVDDNGMPVKVDGNYPAVGYFEKFSPDVYYIYADHMFAYSARYGTNTSTDVLSVLRAHTATATTGVGNGTIKWLEFGNEPNGEDQLGMVPYQLAALQSAAYDGHEKTMVSSKTDSGYHLGAINGDPNMKVAMAGLAGIGGRYVSSMCYWLKANRSDGSIAMDAFNVHCYFSNTFAMNGEYIQVGVSPEFYNMVDAMSGLLEFRDKYYPDKEVWLTEFGWDTNQSYETMTSAHAYGEYTNHQVQAMWLVRAYLLFSSCGIDKATMYMCEDVSDDRYAVGKYGTCGVVGFEDGKEYYKDSYYYIYTLKNTLGDYTFQRELNTGRDDVWVYEYKNGEGKTAYAVWCPTQDGTKVANFELAVNGTSATLIEAVDLDTDGVSSDLTVSGGKVKINVSENPVYVVMD